MGEAGKVEFSFNDREDFEFEVVTWGIVFNDTDSEEFVVVGSGISGIELVGRFEGISEDEEVPDVPEEDDVRLGGEGLGFVSDSIMALGAVELELGVEDLEALHIFSQVLKLSTRLKQLDTQEL